MSDSDADCDETFDDETFSNVFAFQDDLGTLEGNHFDHLKSEEYCSRESLNVLRKSKIEEILKSETDYDIELRSGLSKMSPEMLIRQENDLHKSFADVNYLRAELAELALNRDIPFFRKGLIAKYVVTNRRELHARRVYADLVRAAAVEDLQLGASNQEWVNRVETDIGVVKETRRVRLENKNVPDVVLRKKHDYDYNRAKAILKADLAALTSIWPSDGYDQLIAWC